MPKVPKDMKTMEPERKEDPNQAKGEAIKAPIQGTIIPRHELQAQINQAYDRVLQARNTKKNCQEMIDDEVQALDEYKAVERALEDLAHARENLRVKLLSDKAYNELKEQLFEEKTKEKEAKRVLSDLIVHWSADNRIRNIDVDDENREIVLTGRVGRRLKQEQEILL